VGVGVGVSGFASAAAGGAKAPGASGGGTRSADGALRGGALTGVGGFASAAAGSPKAAGASGDGTRSAGGALRGGALTGFGDGGFSSSATGGGGTASAGRGGELVGLGVDACRVVGGGKGVSVVSGGRNSGSSAPGGGKGAGASRGAFFSTASKHALRFVPFNISRQARKPFAGACARAGGARTRLAVDNSRKYEITRIIDAGSNRQAKTAAPRRFAYHVSSPSANDALRRRCSCVRTAAAPSAEKSRIDAPGAPMFEAAYAALLQILTPPFRKVLFKSIGLTLLLLALAWAGLDKLATSYLAAQQHPFLHSVLTMATGAGLVVFLAFLIAPLSLLVAGFYLDDLAAIVEGEIYPGGEIGRPVSASQNIAMTLRFALVSLAVNFVALLLLLVPGVNAVAFLLANGYLFGREYFALAATRFRSPEATDALRRRNSLKLFLAGLMIAGFVATPGLNLLTPLFGVALMVRLHKKLSPEWR
jgi:CysZ protein